MKLALTFYTDRLPANVGGCANAFIVRIRPKYRNDAGLHAHEYEHVAQFWWMWVASSALLVIIAEAWQLPFEIAFLGCAAHGLLYSLFRDYRASAEARAHAKQVEHGADIHLMAKRMAMNYDLNMSQDECEAWIRDAML